MYVMQFFLYLFTLIIMNINNKINHHLYLELMKTNILSYLFSIYIKTIFYIYKKYRIKYIIITISVLLKYLFKVFH